MWLLILAGFEVVLAAVAVPHAAPLVGRVLQHLDTVHEGRLFVDSLKTMLARADNAIMSGDFSQAQSIVSAVEASTTRDLASFLPFFSHKTVFRVVAVALFRFAQFARVHASEELARAWAGVAWTVSLLGLHPLMEAVASGLVVNEQLYGIVSLPARRRPVRDVVFHDEPDRRYVKPRSYTIVVPVRNPNRERLVSTLESLLASMEAQRIWRETRRLPRVTGELLVVDDKSGDEHAVVDVLHHFSATHTMHDVLSFRWIVRDTNGGAGAARNTGWSQSDSDVVLFADEDDSFYLTHVDMLFSAIELCDRCSKAGAAVDIEGLDDVHPKWMRTLQHVFSSFAFR